MSGAVRKMRATYMKKYYKNYRRKPNMIFFIVLGCIFAVVGVLAFFFVEEGNVLWMGICCGAGVLLAVLPQFVIFERYGLCGDKLRYKRGGIPHSADVKEAGAAVICIYDEYRRGKGFIPATFQSKEGPVPVPALLLFSEVAEEELDLCDRRTAAKITFRKQLVTDMTLDFGFLEELWASGFSGKVYIFEDIAQIYKPAFDDIFKGSDRVSVYDRVPLRAKRAMKERGL